MTILNCRNFCCRFNNKGKCRLENITLQDDGSPLIDRLICVEAEPKGNEDEPLECDKNKDEDVEPEEPKIDHIEDLKNEN